MITMMKKKRCWTTMNKQHWYQWSKTRCCASIVTKSWETWDQPNDILLRFTRKIRKPVARSAKRFTKMLIHEMLTCYQCMVCLQDLWKMQCLWIVLKNIRPSSTPTKLHNFFDLFDLVVKKNPPHNLKNK